MLCGLTLLVSKIKLWIYVKRNPEWECGHFCPFCRYAENCIHEMQAEQ